MIILTQICEQVKSKNKKGGKRKMVVNVDTDIDTNMNKLDEMLEKLKILENKSNMIRFVRHIGVFTIKALLYKNCSRYI